MRARKDCRSYEEGAEDDRERDVIALYVRLDVFFHFIGAFDAALKDLGLLAALDSLGVFVRIAVAFTAAASAFTARAARTVFPSTLV